MSPVVSYSEWNIQTPNKCDVSACRRNTSSNTSESTREWYYCRMGINVIMVLVLLRASPVHPMFGLSGLCPNHLFLFGPSLFPGSSQILLFVLCIKHQVASVISHVRTGLAPLNRLASGLSPVNKITTATAMIMIATAARLRIVQPLLKWSKICGNDREIRL